MQPTLSQRVRHIIGDSFGAEIVEANLEKAIRQAKESAAAPDAVFHDPFSMFLGQDWMGRSQGQQGNLRIGFHELRRMAQNPIIGSIVQTRINQMAAFMKPQQDPYDLGFRISKFDKNEVGDDKFIKEMTMWLYTVGIPEFGEDLLETFCRKFMRDSLILDQGTAEIVFQRDKLPAYVVAVDAATVRRLKASLEYFVPNEDTPFYAQVLQDRVVAEFTQKQMIFGVRNATTSMHNAGYGMPELEILIRTVTTILNGERYNAGQLSQGGTAKGIMVVKGEADKAQMDSFRRDFREAIRNAAQYWRPPVLHVGKDGDIDWVQLDRSNRDMEYAQLMDFLVKEATSVFQMDPSEINWSVSSVGTTTTFESSQTPKQKMSLRRGLEPLLTFFANQLNTNLICRFDPTYVLEFVGMERQRKEDSEIRERETKSFRTVNEVRNELGLEEIEGGDVILNVLFQNSGQTEEPSPLDEPLDKSLDYEDDYTSMVDIERELNG